MGPIICILYLNVINARKWSRLSWARRVEGFEGSDKLLVIRSVAGLFQARKVCMEITRRIQT